MTTLSQLGESAILALIDARLRAQPAASLNAPGAVGPGDDASVTMPQGKLVATTDMIVAGQDFLPAWLAFPAQQISGKPTTAGEAVAPPAAPAISAGSSADATPPGGFYNVGVKAAAQNLADVFAMGADPHGLLVSLGLPGTLSEAQLMDFYTGLLDECARAGTGVLGGDVGQAETTIVSITALGQLADRPPLRRSGAQPGAGVYIAGTVGWAAAGLDLLLAGLAPGDVPALDPIIGVQLAPRPDYTAARRLPGWATACIDASDGLAGDLGRVATASHVDIELSPAAITALAAPLLPAARQLVGRGADREAGALHLAEHWVLTGGEDHGFLCTGPDDNPAAPAPGTPTGPCQCPPVGLRKIGTCSAVPDGGPGQVRLEGAPVDEHGFRHFSH